MTSDKNFEQEKEQRSAKRQRRAPCAYIGWNETQQRDVEMYPTVSCDGKCAFCGWNPEVREKRREKLKASLKGKKAEHGKTAENV